MDRFSVVISENRGEGSFTAQCVEIPGAISQGRTVEEAKANVADAIQMVLAHRRRAAQKAAREPLHFLDVVAVESDA